MEPLSMGDCDMRLVLCTTLVLGFTLCGPVAAEIYKTVDENGNVIYTDQKPTDHAKPLDLPELNVADPHKALPKPPSEVDVPDSTWPGFTLESPADQENVWGSGGSLTVRLSSGQELRRGMNVVIYVDGEAHNARGSLSHTIEGISRGEHRLYAELQARGGRVVATTQPITFHMKQFSQNSRPRGR
jgi:hypothetical protein